MPRFRLLYAGFALLAALLLTACSSSKPEATVEAFYQAAIKRDVDKALGHLDMGKVSESEMFQAKGKIQMIVGQIAANIESNGGLKRIEVLESEIDDDGGKARVRIKLHYNNGEDGNESLRLNRVDGKWKIVLGGW